MSRLTMKRGGKTKRSYVRSSRFETAKCRRGRRHGRSRRAIRRSIECRSCRGRKGGALLMRRSRIPPPVDYGRSSVDHDSHMSLVLLSLINKVHQNNSFTNIKNLYCAANAENKWQKTNTQFRAVFDDDNPANPANPALSFSPTHLSDKWIVESIALLADVLFNEHSMMSPHHATLAFNSKSNSNSTYVGIVFKKTTNRLFHSHAYQMRFIVQCATTSASSVSPTVSPIQEAIGAMPTSAVAIGAMPAVKTGQPVVQPGVVTMQNASTKKSTHQKENIAAVIQELTTSLKSGAVTLKPVNRTQHAASAAPPPSPWKVKLKTSIMPLENAGASPSNPNLITSQKSGNPAYATIAIQRGTSKQFSLTFTNCKTCMVSAVKNDLRGDDLHQQSSHGKTVDCTKPLTVHIDTTSDNSVIKIIQDGKDDEIINATEDTAQLLISFTRNDTTNAAFVKFENLN